MSASEGLIIGLPAGAALTDSYSDEKVPVWALGNKKADTALSKNSSKMIGHAYGVNIFAGTREKYKHLTPTDNDVKVSE